ncbi:MAG TPA: PaaI family thioesterase [Steroidobacteraceae bacterium]|jgi:uncharacterized protein (TIGR00369 family)
MDALESLRANPLPFAKLLGIELISASAELVVGELPVRDELCTLPATAHGGAIMTLADTLGAIGAWMNLAEGSRTTTLESKTNFLGAAAVGSRLRGEAIPIYRGRRTSVWQTRITTTDGKLVALTTQTQLTL